MTRCESVRGASSTKNPFTLSPRHERTRYPRSARRYIGIFATKLYLQNARISLVLISLTQFASTTDKFTIVVWISNPVQCAPDNCLWLATFGSDYCFQRFVRRDVDITSHEGDEVRAQQERLGHPCVVVVRL